MLLGHGHGGTDPVAAAFVDLVDSGCLELPLPGSGKTRERWDALASLGQRDLALACLAEGHVDACAVLAELGARPPRHGERWGVWATPSPGHELIARRSGDAGWWLDGVKPSCSGARSRTHALITARAADGWRLFAADVTQPGCRPELASWSPGGMMASDTLDVAFEAAIAVPIGRPGAYRDRPGFHHSGIGVAACWYGGAVALARSLRRAATEYGLGAGTRARLGEVDAELRAGMVWLDVAAREIDQDPEDHQGGARERALRVRAAVAGLCEHLIAVVGEVFGAGARHDERYAKAVADLTAYLRRPGHGHNAGSLGELVAEPAS